jgi:DNA repair protein RadA/Sms
LPKPKSQFVCQNCGSKSPKWLGKCNDCGQWNTYVEESLEAPATSAKGRKLSGGDSKAVPMPLNGIEVEAGFRYRTGIGEFDRVLGGGIVPGAAVLIGGDPGIGKSTLLLQALHRLSVSSPGTFLYITGEESPQQVKLRAERLGLSSDRLWVYAETDVHAILETMDKVKPSLTVVDSIQTLYLPELASAPGSVSQIRESAARLIYAAKREGRPLFLVGHVTKDGGLAGPMVLEHMVDAVLYFEGDVQRQYRIMRSVKNRYGSTQEIGLFEMHEQGLMEVPDASKLFLSTHEMPASGSVITVSLEGTRPLLLEIQALVTPSSYGMAQRRATGIDSNRLALLLAILEKRLGLPLSAQDVFLNVAGGLKVVEPSVDLAVACAVVSSYREAPVDARTVVVGEVGLSGEVRAVSRASERTAEAARLGFKEAVVPFGNLKDTQLKTSSIRAVTVKTLSEAVDLLLPH